MFKSIYTPQVYPPKAPKQRPCPRRCPRGSPALLTCAFSVGDRRPSGARRGRCHVLPHPAGARASPDRPTSPRAGGCTPRRVSGMLGGARGCFSGSEGSRTGRPAKGEKQSVAAFPCPGRCSPSGRVAHLRSTGPAAWFFIGPEARRGALALPGPRAPFTAPLSFPARPRPVRPTASSRASPSGERFRLLSHSGRVSGFSATRRTCNLFTACALTLPSVPAHRPSDPALRVRIAELREWAGFGTRHPERALWVSIQPSAESSTRRC